MSRESYIVKKRPDGTVDVVRKDKLAAWLAKHQPEAAKGYTAKACKVERGSWVWREGKLVPKHEAAPLTRGRGLQVIKDIEPFQNIAIDNGYIGGRRQRRDMMKAHELIEVGTEPPVNRKRDPEFNVREFAEDTKRAYRQHGVDVL